MTVTDLCAEVKNWFDVSRRFGNFQITDGTINLDFLQEGQFFRIVGSVFNDGVYQYPYLELKDEEFEGSIWALAIPPAFIELSKKISEWETEHAKELDSPYQSESFGGYSYSKESNSGESLSWQSKFRKDLNRWRKV